MRNDDGQILLITAFTLLALCALMAVALDASYAYDVRNRLAGAADHAAKSGAYEIWRGNSTNYAAFSNVAIDRQVTAGVVPTNVQRSVLLCSDPGAHCEAAHQTNRYVEVVLRSDYLTAFGWVAGMGTLQPTARAVAGTSSSPGCLLTLTGGMKQSNPVGSVTTTNCTVAVAGEFNVTGTLVADEISAGSCVNGCADVQIGPPPSDPLAGLPAPTAADCGSTHADMAFPTGTTALSSGTYHNLTFSGGGITLSGGIYCITGEVTASSPGQPISIIGTSPTLIYIAPGGRFNLATNDLTLTLDALTTGTWAGIAMYQDRTNSNDVVFGKNLGDVDTNGALYFPAAQLQAKNANFVSSDMCGILIAASIDWDKPNLNMTNTCGSFAGSPLTSVALAE